MKHLLILAGMSSLSFVAHMSDVCETITVKGDDGKALIINKTDYDANPDKWDKLGETKQADQPVGGTVTSQVPPGATVPLAPATPDFLSNPPTTAPAPTPAVLPGQMLVSPVRGTGAKARYFVIEADGAGNFRDTDRPGIETTGYVNDSEAWDAIRALTT